MQIKPKLVSLFGFNIQGDIGGMTAYRSARHRFTWFAATTPKEPQTPCQENLRARWTMVAAVWAALPHSAKAEWQLAAQTARLRITAYNLFMHCHTTQDQAILDTINNQTGSNLQLNPQAP
jgi:hypothetical protein